MASIFISHSSGDKPWLWGIVHKLRLLGHRIFIDDPNKVRLSAECGIEIGELWYERLSSELEAVDVVLAIWTRAAAERFRQGRAQVFAREIFWAAAEGKLALAVIDQNRLPSRNRDQAFLDETAPLDLSPLFAMLAKDPIYGPQRERIERFLTERQHFRIEGTRFKNQRLEGDVGLMRLHREKLSPQPQASTQRNLDFDSLDAALASIDRKPQVEQMKGAIDRSASGVAEAVGLVAGSECEPHYVLRRIDAIEREVDWRRFYSGNPAERQADFRQRVDAVLADIHAIAGAGAQAKPVVIHTLLTLGSSELRKKTDIEQVLSEWRVAIDGISLSPRVPVLFCATVKDDTALDEPEPDVIAARIAAIPLGRVPASDIRSWCEAGLLMSFLKKSGMSLIRDERGFEVPANVWIRERVSNELKRLGEQAPTMRQAVRIASESVQAAYDARLHERARAANQPPVLTSSF